MLHQLRIFIPFQLRVLAQENEMIELLRPRFAVAQVFHFADCNFRCNRQALQRLARFAYRQTKNCHQLPLDCSRRIPPSTLRLGELNSNQTEQFFPRNLRDLLFVDWNGCIIARDN